MSQLQVNHGDKAYVLRHAVIVASAANPPRWLRLLVRLDRRLRR